MTDGMTDATSSKGTAWSGIGWRGRLRLAAAVRRGRRDGRRCRSSRRRKARRGAQNAAPDAAPGVSQGELQRLFDAYVLMQAQETLQLTDAQYPQFLARLRALQEVRRRTLVERTRIIQELRRIVQGRVEGADSRTGARAAQGAARGRGPRRRGDPSGGRQPRRGARAAAAGALARSRRADGAPQARSADAGASEQPGPGAR